MYVTFSTVPTSHQDFGTDNPRHLKPALDRTVKASGYLFREGDEVSHLFEVTEGVLRMTRLLEDGRRQVIAFGYPGDIVGFPSDGLHHTDCDALGMVKVRPYPASALKNDHSNPSLHQMLLQAALSEISAMQDHFMMLGRKSAAEKMASFLCALKDRVGEPLGQYEQVNLPMSRADIADFLSLTTETVSRTFTQLRKCGIIALDNIHTVIILKPNALEAIARGDG